MSVSPCTVVFLAQKWVIFNRDIAFCVVPKLEPRLTKRFFTFYNEAIWSILQNKSSDDKNVSIHTYKLQSFLSIFNASLAKSSMLFSVIFSCLLFLFNRSSSVIVQGIRKQLKISAKNNQRSCSDKSRYTHTNVVYLDLGALSSFLFFSGMKGRSRGRNCKCTSRYCVNCILSLPAIVKSCTAFKYVVKLTYIDFFGAKLILV